MEVLENLIKDLKSNVTATKADVIREALDVR